MNIAEIRERIYFIRSRKVMLDRDLAMLYEVPTMQLNRAVRRNLTRFPPDFMFQLNASEMRNWKEEFGTADFGLNRGLRKPPLAFTEQGIAMLSSVLKSERAILVNIQIIRIFTKLRDMIEAYKELREKVEEMERNHKTNFNEVFKILRNLIKQEETPKHPIGFNLKK